jgi:hypothetical protein
MTHSLSPALLKIHQSALLAAGGFKNSETKLLDSLIAVEKSGVHLKLGFTSLFRYSLKSLGLSEAVSYNAIAVARKIREVPALRNEVGEIGISKTRKMVSVLTNENQEEWILKAKTLNTRALEKAVARENPKEATPEVTKYVSDQRLDLRLGIDEELLVKLRRAQDQVSQSRGKAVSLEETLREAVSFYLHHKDPLEKARRVIAKKGFESLNKLFTGTVPACTPNPTAPPGQPGSRPKRAPIPKATEHEVRLRDLNQCQAPSPGGGVCGERRWIDLHHLKPVSQGGTNAPENLVILCRAHHRLKHAND